MARDTQRGIGIGAEANSKYKCRHSLVNAIECRNIKPSEKDKKRFRVFYVTFRHPGVLDVSASEHASLKPTPNSSLHHCSIIPLTNMSLHMINILSPSTMFVSPSA